jgi:NAD(P)-dependent dehydrogenase (short-subunit alcohol dehydrogenase family)
MSERVLLTGASRGIGRAIAELFRARGAKVVLAVREPAAPDLQPLLREGSCALQLDLRDRAQTASLVARAADALGGIDVLVNCAGIVRYEPLDALSRESLEEQLEVNFIAPSVLARDAAALMAAAGSGAIVNVASTLGLRPAPLTAAYGASKAALISLTRSLALEYGAAGVRVNAVAPGIIDTDMVRVQRDSGVSLDQQLDALRQLHVMRRLGTVQEVAEAVLYLVDARFVTGTVLVADGGAMLL